MLVLLRAWILGDGGGRGVTKRCNGVVEDDSRDRNEKRQAKKTHPGYQPP